MHEEKEIIKNNKKEVSAKVDQFGCEIFEFRLDNWIHLFFISFHAPAVSKPNWFASQAFVNQHTHSAKLEAKINLILFQLIKVVPSEDCLPTLSSKERILTYFTRESITVWLTSCLTGLDQPNKSICCKFNMSKSAECTQVKQEVIQTVILPLWRKWIFSDLVESILMPMRIAVSEGEWISALRCLQLYSSLSSILLVWLRQGVAKNLVQLLSKCWRRNQLAL